MCPRIKKRPILVGISVVCLVSSSRAAQDPDLRPDIPGTYAIRKCTTAEFPPELPSLDMVLDVSRLTAALREVGVDKRVVFTLRLGAQQAAPGVRVREKKVSNAVAERAAQTVEAALNEVTSDRPWAFRLIVDGEHGQAMTLARSQVCGAAPGSRPAGPQRLMEAPVTELARMQREAEDYRRRRRAMLHRVLVDAGGRVRAVELRASSGDAQMDANEANALRNASFAPTKLDGVPVSAWIELRGDAW